jgi:hypothetical protein
VFFHNEKLLKLGGYVIVGNEFDYIMSISTKLCAGKWIAVVQKDVIEGNSAKEVVERARTKYPKKEPFVMKVPNNANMLL